MFQGRDELTASYLMLKIVWKVSHLPSPVPTTWRRRNKEFDIAKGRSGWRSSHESDLFPLGMLLTWGSAPCLSPDQAVRRQHKLQHPCRQNFLRLPPKTCLIGACLMPQRTGGWIPCSITSFFPSQICSVLPPLWNHVKPPPLATPCWWVPHA